MDYSQAFAISAAGMAVERMRVDVAALNLANANTVQSVAGTSYQPQRVVTRARAVTGADASWPSFAERVDRGSANSEVEGLSVPYGTIESTDAAPRMVYEPGHPFANEKGFVAYPGVDTATEMVSLMSAMRAYEANVAAMNAARTLALKALEIGGAV